MATKIHAYSPACAKLTTPAQCKFWQAHADALGLRFDAGAVTGHAFFTAPDKSAIPALHQRVCGAGGMAEPQAEFRKREHQRTYDRLVLENGSDYANKWAKAIPFKPATTRA